MFALDDDTLTRCEFLDCASGASAFGAELRARGGHVLSADPLYTAGLDAVRQRALHNLKHSEQWLDAHSVVIDWDHLISPATYRQAGLRALDLFSEDFAAYPDRSPQTTPPGGSGHFSSLPWLGRSAAAGGPCASSQSTHPSSAPITT